MLFVCVCACLSVSCFFVCVSVCRLCFVSGFPDRSFPQSPPFFLYYNLRWLTLSHCLSGLRTLAALVHSSTRIAGAALPCLVALVLQLLGRVSRATPGCLTLRKTHTFLLPRKSWVMMWNYTAGGAREDMVHVGVVCPNNRRVTPIRLRKHVISVFFELFLCFTMVGGGCLLGKVKRRTREGRLTYFSFLFN